MAPVIASGLLSVGAKLIERLFPDPTAQAEAKLKLLALERDGELRELELTLSAIQTEGASADPWTSRARPSFLYVMYALILAAIPMGVLHALEPALATSIAEGFKQWLAALPEELWWLFGTGYLGYTGARSFDKRLTSKKPGG